MPRFVDLPTPSGVRTRVNPAAITHYCEATDDGPPRTILFPGVGPVLMSFEEVGEALAGTGPGDFGPDDVISLTGKQPDLTASAKAKTVDEIAFSTRVRNCLERAHVETLGQLAKWSPWELMDLEHFGAVCLNEVRRVLAEEGLSLRGDATTAVGAGPT